MMKELYDITVLFLRCLRNFEKWSWILILRKNEEKSGKMVEPESPYIYYCYVTIFFIDFRNSLLKRSFKATLIITYQNKRKQIGKWRELMLHLSIRHSQNSSGFQKK